MFARVGIAGCLCRPVALKSFEQMDGWIRYIEENKE
jgi:hypothetical protein